MKPGRAQDVNLNGSACQASTGKNKSFSLVNIYIDCIQKLTILIFMHANDSIKFLGTSDEVSTCDCCGRKDLKSTVALSIDDGEAVYFGVTCAARALAMDAKLVRKASKAADDEKYRAEQAARRAKADAEFAKWDAFLKTNGTGTCVFTRIASLGGYAAARALYEKQAA